jgi:hypothetical protein
LADQNFGSAQNLIAESEKIKMKLETIRIEEIKVRQFLEMMKTADLN